VLTIVAFVLLLTCLSLSHPVGKARQSSDDGKGGVEPDREEVRS
jgi:hypothetical protein